MTHLIRLILPLIILLFNIQLIFTYTFYLNNICEQRLLGCAAKPCGSMQQCACYSIHDILDQLNEEKNDFLTVTIKVAPSPNSYILNEPIQILNTTTQFYLESYYFAIDVCNHTDVSTEKPTILCNNTIALITNAANNSVDSILFQCNNENTSAAIITTDDFHTKERQLLINSSAFLSCTTHNGAIYWLGLLSIENTQFNNNNALNGGAIHVVENSVVSISDSHFVSNEATNNGGAIFASDDSVVDIYNSTFLHNTAIHNGGSIFTNGKLKVTESAIAYSKANNGSAIYMVGEGVFDMAKFSTNSAHLFGASIYLTSTPTQVKQITFNNCNFSSNTVATSSLISNGGFKGNIYFEGLSKHNDNLPDCQKHFNGITINDKEYGRLVNISYCTFDNVMEYPTFITHSIGKLKFYPSEIFATSIAKDICGWKIEQSTVCGAERIDSYFIKDGEDEHIAATTLCDNYNRTYYSSQPTIVKQGKYFFSVILNQELTTRKEPFIIIAASVESTNSILLNATVLQDDFYCNRTRVSYCIAVFDSYNNSCPCSPIEEVNIKTGTYQNFQFNVLEQININSDKADLCYTLSYHKPETVLLSFEVNDYRLPTVSQTTVNNGIVGNGSAFSVTVEGGTSNDVLEAGNTVNVTALILGAHNSTLPNQQYLFQCANVILHYLEPNSTTIVQQFIADDNYPYFLAREIELTTAGPLQLSVTFNSKMLRNYFTNSDYHQLQVNPSKLDEKTTILLNNNSQPLMAHTSLIIDEPSFIFYLKFRDKYSNIIRDCSIPVKVVVTSNAKQLGKKDYSIERRGCNTEVGSPSFAFIAKHNNLEYNLGIFVNGIQIDSSPITISAENIKSHIAVGWIIGFSCAAFVILIVVILAIVIFLMQMKSNRANYQLALEQQPLLDLTADNSKLTRNQILKSFEDLLRTSTIPRIAIADLETVKIIGSGASGTVSHAIWKQFDSLTGSHNNIDVALKELHTTNSFLNTLELDSFVKEISLASNLKHPNIVRFLGVSVTSSRLVLVIEYMSLGSLSEVVSAKGALITATKRLKFALDIANGMKYLHSRNIIHRDLKPANLLLDEHGTCKIADFGIATVKPDKTITMTLVGSPIYMAPEVLETSKYSEKADIYSFGILLCELLTGEFPYAGESEGHFMVLGNKIIKGLRPETKKLPVICAKLIMDCWDADPSRRPTFSKIIPILHNISKIQREISSIQSALDDTELTKNNKKYAQSFPPRSVNRKPDANAEEFNTNSTNDQDDELLLASAIDDVLQGKQEEEQEEEEEL